MKQCQFHQEVASEGDDEVAAVLPILYIQFRPPCTAREGRDCHHYQETEKMSNFMESGPKHSAVNRSRSAG